MIEYRLFTKPELLKWRKDRGLDEPPPDLDHFKVSVGAAPRIGLQQDNDTELTAPRCTQEIDNTAICAICAFDDGHLVGRISIRYFDLQLDAQRLRCAVGSGFMVLKAYRNSAVGLSILLKAMNLGMPYFEAGVSGQMDEILGKMPQFHMIDNSPIFQLGLDGTGKVQVAKWEHFSKSDHGNRFSEQVAKLHALVRSWKHFRRVSHAASARSILDCPEAATTTLEKYLSAVRFRVQVPWNRDLLVKGLHGDIPNFGVWLVSAPNDASRVWLLTLYRRDRVLGRGSKREPHILKEAHLNEIYPPLRSKDPVLPLLAFASHQASISGASILHIHALTSALEKACIALGMRNQTRKRIFVTPGNTDEGNKKLLIDPESWWCRAFSEDQLEEAFDADKNMNKLMP